VSTPRDNNFFFAAVVARVEQAAALAASAATDLVVCAYLTSSAFAKRVRTWCCGDREALVVATQAADFVALAYGRDCQWLAVATWERWVNHRPDIEAKCRAALAAADCDGDRPLSWSRPDIAPLAAILGAMVVWRDAPSEYVSLTELVEQLAGPRGDFAPNLSTTLDGVLSVAGVPWARRTGSVVFFGASSTTRVDLSKVCDTTIGDVVHLLCPKKSC
jgi:hypothetical protein